MRSQKGQKGLTQKQSQAVKKSEGRKRNRAKYQCPPEVRKLIDLANSIPPELPLPHLHDLDDDATTATCKIRGLLTGVPQEFIAKHLQISAAYVEFRLIRMTLRDIANLVLLKDTDKKSPGDRRYYRAIQHHLGEPSDEFRERFGEVEKLRRWTDFSATDLKFGRVPFEPWFQVNLIVSDDGSIEAEPVSQIAALSQIKENADRLRICEFCDRIYWANKSNQVTCSPRCSNARQQQNHRDKEKQAQYEQARKIKGRGTVKAAKRRK